MDMLNCYLLLNYRVRSIYQFHKSAKSQVLNILLSRRHDTLLYFGILTYKILEVMHSIASFCQFAFGVIPNVRAKGVASTKAAELLNNMQLEDPVNMDDVTPTDLFLFFF